MTRVPIGRKKLKGTGSRPCEDVPDIATTSQERPLEAERAGKNSSLEESAAMLPH